MLEREAKSREQGAKAKEVGKGETYSSSSRWRETDPSLGTRQVFRKSQAVDSKVRTWGQACRT